MNRFSISISCASILLPLQVFAGTLVNAPCNDIGTTASPGLNTCQALLLDGTPAVPATSTFGGVPAVPGIRDQVHSRIAEQIDGNLQKQTKGYYQNEDFTGQQGVAPEHIGPTVCNLVQGEFTPVIETIQDHHGKTCGKPMDIRVAMNWSYDPWPLDDCVHGASPTVTAHREWNAQDPTQSPGTLETGYMHGGLIQATSCFYTQVMNEVLTKKQLTVADLGGHPSPCASIANDIVGKTNQVTQGMASLKAQLIDKGVNKNIEDIINCSKTWDTTSSNTSVDKGPLRQSAQLLCAARSAIESMFSQLVSCEVLARTQYSYVNNIGRADKQQDVINMLKKVTAPCADSCKASLDKGRCHPPQDGAVSACVNKCYSEKIQGTMGVYIKSLWPSSGQCQPLSSSGGNSPDPTHGSMGLMIGMIGIVNGRRKKSHRFSQAKLHQVISSVLFLGMTTLYAAGCASGSGDLADVPLVPKPDCGIDNPSFCCNAQGVIDATQPGCSTQTPGFNAIGGAQGSAAQASSAAGQALNDAGRLLGPNGAAEATGGNFAQGQAASDSGTVTAPGARLAGSVSQGGNGLGTGANAAGSRSLTGSGSAGSGGTGSSFGDLKTSASPTLDTGSAAAATDDKNIADYKASAGAGGLTAAGGAGFGAHNGGVTVGEGLATTEEGFGHDTAQGELGKTAGSTDPEDYFTRLGLNDSLFKIVEKKYREKSTSWVTTEISGFKTKSSATTPLK